jgi:hypothetical protein
MLRIPLSQPQKRHIQPERYTKCPLNFFENIMKKYRGKVLAVSKIFSPAFIAAGAIRGA